MIEKMRDILSKDSEISLRKLNADSKKNVVEKFTILSTIEENDGLPSTREGGSAVCYEAVDENGVSGRLKEFYPFYDNQGYNLVRLGNHQLVVEKSIFGEDDFKRDCDDLITTYRLIDEARNINSSDLNNYMPSSIELYEGYSSYDGTVGSIYVWTKNDKRIITFDKYLNVVKGDVLNGKNAEIHLLNILNAICTLSKCIRSLHRNHIYHLDIKPANFGVCLGIDNRVDATNISLFDLNSVRHWNSELPLKFVGTRGFSPGELTQGNKLVISAYSDIYSIGATLYHSLMCLNESNVYFNDADYNKIKRLVASSELLCTSDINSNSRLFDCLVKILSECLNPDYNNRYKDSCCDGLIFDLNNAIDILYPEAKKQKTNKLGSEVKVQSEIVDIETELDTSIKTGATGAIQRLLLNKPLYEYMGNNTDMNILVLGGGTYARKFIDFAFEVSQIKDCKLTITVVSNECESDKERYLAARPAFEKFFTVDDKIVPEKDSYGTLLFKSTVTATGKDRLFSKDNIEVNNAIINDVLGAERDTKVSYIFIALGDDELNREIAKECMKHSELLSEKNLISFVQYKKQVKRCYEFCSSNANVVPVMVNEVITKSPEYKELRRMAFNCHILWDNTLSINIQKAKGKFSAPYYFNSSFSNVLSIKYKLHSMGIDLKKYSQCELMKYAEEFYKEITNVITLNELAMYEHRRWTTNCICDGWDTLEDYSS